MKKGSKEWEDWCAVYEYMKEIMGYGEDIKLPKYMMFRLKGLSEGKFIANKKQKPHGSYEFSTILITMKICRSAVNSYVMRNSSKFTGEKHKFNGIMIIIENEINDVVMRLKRVEKSEDKVKEADMTHQQHKSAQYKKQEKKKNDRLNDLW